MTKLIYILMFVCLLFVGFRVWGIWNSATLAYLPIHPRGLQMPINDLFSWTSGNSTGTPMVYPKATANPLYNPQKTCFKFMFDEICQ